MPAAATGELIRPVTVSHVQVQHRAITGVPLPPGVTRSPVEHLAAAVALTVVRAVHRAAVVALTVVRAAPAAVAVLTVVRAAPAAVAVRTAVPVVHRAAAVEAILLAAAVADPRAAAVADPRAAAAADPRAAALQVHHQVQDVKLSLTAGILPLIPAFLRFKYIQL